MAGLNLSGNRTAMFANEANIRASHKGMAHFAGTGPDGAICKQCAHFAFDDQSPWDAQACLKYRQIATGKRVKDKIPARTAACKYFEAGRK